jgi:hypothetical protein
MPSEDPVTPVAGTPGPAARASRVQPAAARESRAPASASVHPVVQAIDHLGELAVVLLAGYGWIHGKTSFELFALLSCTVLGVQNGIRRFGGRTNGASVSGALGLVVATASAAYLRSRGVLQVLALLALAGASGAGLTACTAAQGQQLATSGNAVVKAARAVCGWILRIPADPFPAGGAAPSSSGGPTDLPPIAITADAGAGE